MKKNILINFILLLVVVMYTQTVVYAVDGLTPEQQATNDAGNVVAQGVSAEASAQTPQSAAQAYAFKSQGIFGCNLNGAYAMSVGAMSAIGGVYVPVNDAAVTLNTGTLVYKECILRSVVNAERQAALAGNQKNFFNQFVKGNDGQAYFPTILSKSKTERSDRDIVYFVNNYMDKAPAYAQAYVAKKYKSETRTPEDRCTCPYSYAVAVMNRTDTDMEHIYNVSTDKRCNPIYAAQCWDDLSSQYIADGQSDMMTRLQWSNGVFDKVTINEKNQYVVSTPGFLTRASAEAASLSGQNQMEMANDLGQMVGALYAGLSTQILSDAGGLVGSLQSMGGRPSYLDQMVAEQSANVRSSASNLALQTLAATRSVEVSYLQVFNSIADALKATIVKLRGAENQCWSLIVSKVCTTAMSSDNTCTSTTINTDATGATSTVSVQLKVATTSYQFAQKLIDSQIKPLSTPAITAITNSQKAVAIIDGMIAGITNTNSLDAQRLALVQLDTLTASRALHTQYDVQQASTQLSAAQSQMDTLYQNTVTAWGDSTDTNIGWCNVNNPAVVGMWKTRWKK